MHDMHEPLGTHINHYYCNDWYICKISDDVWLILGWWLVDPQACHYKVSFGGLCHLGLTHLEAGIGGQSARDKAWAPGDGFGTRPLGGWLLWFKLSTWRPPVNYSTTVIQDNASASLNWYKCFGCFWCNDYYFTMRSKATTYYHLVSQGGSQLWFLHVQT